MRHYQPLFQPTEATGGAGDLSGGISLSQQQAADQERTFAEFNKAASEAYKKYSERYRKYARNGPPNAAAGGGVVGGAGSKGSSLPIYQQSQAIDSTGRGGAYGYLHSGQAPHHPAGSHIHGVPAPSIPGTASAEFVQSDDVGDHPILHPPPDKPKKNKRPVDGGCPAGKKAKQDDVSSEWGSDSDDA